MYQPAFSTGLVTVPVANVFGAVGMLVDAKALRHVVDEFTLVKVTGRMIQLATAVVEVVLPETLINSAIRPPHDSIALLHI